MFSYSQIATPKTNTLFQKYIKEVSLENINYIAIAIQDLTSKSISELMSSANWQKIFGDNNYVQHDPLCLLALNTTRNIIFLDEVAHIDSRGSKIMQHRKNAEIENGIMLIKRYQGYNYTLTLGSSYKKFDPYTCLIENYLLVEEIFKDLQNIICNDLPSAAPELALLREAAS